jgi:hypothetical protein
MKTEMQLLVNKMKIEAGQFEGVVMLVLLRAKWKNKLEYTSNWVKSTPGMATTRKVNTISHASCENRPPLPIFAMKSTFGSGDAKYFTS